jgi:hypothetical protein
MLGTHEPVVIREFNGRWNNGRNDVCPADHAIDEKNNVFSQAGVESRYGSALAITIGSARRVLKYARTGEADRLLILRTDGKLYDSTNLATPILDIPLMTDFSLQVMFNRAYISPHTREKGLAGEFLYVYQGSGTARKAAGSAPTSFTLGAATSASAGHVDAGKYLLAVAYEFDTGFITKPGPVGAFTLYDAPGSKKIDISTVPVGPTGVVARHILSSKVILNDAAGATTYTGRQDDYEMFFIPNGTISNNSGNSITVDYFSADLQASADYLLDQLESIPAGLGMCDYQGRLCLWAQDDSEDIIRTSKSGEPESFSDVDGFILANPGDSGGGVKCCLEFKGSLNIHKSQRSYTTRDDGINEPSTWKVIDLDKGVGTECFGISEVLDSRGNTMDRYLMASRSGLLQFIGNFAEKELTWKVQDLWARINKAAFNTIQVCLDPVGKEIYVAIPLDSATSPSHILYGDYNYGMDAANIRWSLWSFPTAPDCIAIDVNYTTKETIFRFGSLAGNIYKMDKTALTDAGPTVITAYYETALVSSETDGGVSHFARVRLRVVGVGSLIITSASEDRATTTVWPSIGLGLTPGKEMERRINFQAGRASFKFSVESSGDYYKINTIRIFCKPLWMSRPE